MSNKQPKHYRLLADLPDPVVFNPGEFGTVTGENRKLADVPFKQLDAIVLTERSFASITNFDSKDSKYEINYDLLLIDFTRGSQNFKPCYFILGEDTYVYVISDTDVLVGAKLEKFNKPEAISGSFRNGNLGKQKFIAANLSEDAMKKIASEIDKYIESGYPEE